MSFIVNFFIVDDIICSFIIANKLPYIQWPGATINPSQRHFNVSYWFWVIAPYKRTENEQTFILERQQLHILSILDFLWKKIELFLFKIRHLERKKLCCFNNFRTTLIFFDYEYFFFYNFLRCCIIKHFCSHPIQEWKVGQDVNRHVAMDLKFRKKDKRNHVKTYLF